MRIAFVLPGTEGRPKPLNGHTIRYNGAACSGTDQSVIFVAEYLAKQGNEVVISIDRIDEIGSVENVFYTNRHFENVENKEFDILVTCLWMGEYHKLPIKVTKSLIYWYHLAWGYGMGEIVEYAKANKLTLGLVSPSDWAQHHNDSNWDFFSRNIPLTIKRVIPNPIATDLAKTVLAQNYPRKPKSMIFHAQHNRGRYLAERAAKELGWEDSYEFTRMDYLDPTMSNDKQSLFTALAQSEYFVFPLVTFENTVYKDTFSCAVAEAIALGVTVITYPLGALPELFKNHCVFLDFPPGSNIKELQEERLTQKAMYMDYTENIKQTLLFLEDNPQIKENIRSTSLEYIDKNFSIDVVGEYWVEFIEDVINQKQQIVINETIDEVSNTKGYFINLEHRKDRLEQITHELNRTGIQAERFDAYNLTQEQCDEIGGIRWQGESEWRNKLIKGQYSCTSSHLEIIKLAKQQNLDKVLILEDDCQFEQDINIKMIVNEVFKELKDKNMEWDMLFLGANLIIPPTKTLSPNLIKMNGAYCAHAYYVNKNFYDKILEFSFDRYYTIDVYYNELMRHSNVYCIKPLLAVQQQSHSDIEGYKVNYEEVIRNSYRQNGNS